MRFFQSCGALLLAVALLFVSTTSVKAQNPFEAAMSGVSFSKKDFADTIKTRVFDGAVIVPVEIEERARHSHRRPLHLYSNGRKIRGNADDLAKP